MKLRHFLVGLALILSPALLLAKEGMWIPTLLEAVEADMQSCGLNLSAEDIYSINQSSLKDAIVHFNGGCTAEMISDRGLLLTNHHCGYGQIQYHSSLENDYLRDGFWAMSLEEELMNPDLSATFILRIEDVTALLMEGGSESFEANIAKLEEENSQGLGIEAHVMAFNYGNDYYMIVTKTYEDVRLVGAPPSSVGKFGGDTDNWMWPRHTGDFSIFRIYADENNEPAEYSESNVPYKPAHSLPINMDGVQEGDFTMVFGFPGKTEQYLTSYAVEYVMEKANPMRIHMRENSLAIIDAAMNADRGVKIQYAAKQSRISNAYKKWIGQNRGLKILDALEVKRNEERIIADRGDEFAGALKEFERVYAELEPFAFGRDLFIEYYFVGPEIYRFAKNFEGIVKGYDDLVANDGLKEEVDNLKASIAGHFKNYQIDVDRDVANKLTELYLSYSKDEFLPQYFKDKKKWLDKGCLVDKMFDKSIFASEEKMQAMINNFGPKSVEMIQEDPAYIIACQLWDGYFENIAPDYGRLGGQINAMMKNHVNVLEETFPEKVMWADANSTLRLTYGKAEGSEMKDGVEYKFYTTSRGILAKYDPENPDFVLPERLIELLESEDFGEYATDGELRVCFTGSNHTTGGNSGSPALDGNGHLIGLNFDRTWESTMSDIMFDPDRCRNIMVDIKYVLFIVDKYAGAGHLIEEMDLRYGSESLEEMIIDEIEVMMEE